MNTEYNGDDIELDGFLIELCADRDDNGFCGDGVDYRASAYANDDHSVNGCKNDKKEAGGCEDITDELIFCVQRELEFLGPPLNLDADGGWDDIIVFIFTGSKSLPLV